MLEQPMLDAAGAVHYDLFGGVLDWLAKMFDSVLTLKVGWSNS